MTCPCGKGDSLEACCGPYLKKSAVPETAEALMRSRYTAFAVGDIDYIFDTHDPDTVHQVERAGTESWSKQSEWLGLEILDAELGGPNDYTGTVEFIAKYKIRGTTINHREIATFRKQNGRWLFVADYTQGIARIEPGSGAVTLLPGPEDAALGGIDGLVYASAVARTAPDSRALRRSTAFVWSCDTRDSVTPSTSPISRRVSSS